MSNNDSILWILISALLLLSVSCQSTTNTQSNATANKSPASANSLAPANMLRIGTIDERYQSYNVEMLEVTGGKFWKPYRPELEAILKSGHSQPVVSSGATPAGRETGLY